MIKKIIAVVAVFLIIAIGIVAYSFLRTPEEASGPIEAVPITTDAQESTVADVSATAEEAEPQADTALETDTAAESDTQAEASTNADAATAPGAEGTIVSETGEQASSEGDETTTSSFTFEIVPAESQARFLIDEVLRGSPVTVVGATDQVTGQLALNPNDLSGTQVGTIQVNARTLATDNDFRNRAVKNQILRTNDHEFVTFTPTEVVGLPETGITGETYNFQIVGDLTVTDVTRPVTFDVVATATSESRIEGTATTAFPYTDFELFIPDAPAVDTVDDVVRLELEFVADAIS